MIRKVLVKNRVSKNMKKGAKRGFLALIVGTVVLVAKHLFDIDLDTTELVTALSVIIAATTAVADAAKKHYAEVDED